MGDGRSFLKSDPPLQCYFHVAIGGELTGRFMTCTGLNHEVEVETYQEGGMNNGPHILVAGQVPQRLVLERGVATVDGTVAWLRAMQMGTFQRMAGEVMMFNTKGVPIHLWIITDAVPVKYEGPSLDAMGDKVAITRLEIMHKGVLPVY